MRRISEDQPSTTEYIIDAQAAEEMRRIFDDPAKCGQ